MTTPDVPVTKLDELREQLHAAMVDTFAVLGWPADRVHLFPPRQPVAPTCWVDVPTMAQSSVGGAPGTAATFPVCVSVDGIDTAQVQQLDKLLAFGVQKLQAIDGATVLTAGPDSIDLGTGMTTRAVIFQVQSVLMLRTLCTGTITARNEPQETTP